MGMTSGPAASDPLSSGLRAMRGQVVATPRRLTRKVMADIGAHPRPGREIPIPGNASVSETEIAALIRTTADSVEGVCARGCRIKPCRDVTGTPIIGPVDVELSFAVSYGSNIPAVSGELALKARTVLSQRYGLSTGRLNFKAVDLTSRVVST